MFRKRKRRRKKTKTYPTILYFQGIGFPDFTSFITKTLLIGWNKTSVSDHRFTFWCEMAWPFYWISASLCVCLSICLIVTLHLLSMALVKPKLYLLGVAIWRKVKHRSCPFFLTDRTTSFFMRDKDVMCIVCNPCLSWLLHFVLYAWTVLCTSLTVKKGTARFVGVWTPGVKKGSSRLLFFLIAALFFFLSPLPFFLSFTMPTSYFPAAKSFEEQSQGNIDMNQSGYTGFSKKMINSIDVQEIDTNLYMSRELWRPTFSRGVFGGMVGMKKEKDIVLFNLPAHFCVDCSSSLTSCLVYRSW